MRYQVAPHCIIEQLGDELLICDPSREIALQVTGTTAQVFRQFQTTGSLDGAEPESIVSLVDAGILLPVGQQGLLGRRALITAGAGVVGLGIVALALPNAAAASSGGGGGGFGPEPDAGRTPEKNEQPSVFGPFNDTAEPEFGIQWRVGSDFVPYTWSITAAINPVTGQIPNTGESLTGQFQLFPISTWRNGQTLTLKIAGSPNNNYAVYSIDVTRPA